MVVIPAGSFLMGDLESDGERPQHRVTLAAFAMGVTELTFADYHHCVAAGACERTDDEGWGRGSRPVINVSWDDAQRYVAWLNGQTGKRFARQVGVRGARRPADGVLVG